MTPSRDKSIDILRAIALIGMIISHCKPHPFVQQLREFDVPLIVFLSGVSFLMSSKKKSYDGYLSYCWKRFKRLVFPTWIFLFLYYIVLFVGLSYTGNLSFDWSSIVHNFTLTTGWYVWIIRVFLIIALLAPSVYYLCSHLSYTIFIILFVLLLIGYEFVAKITDAEWYYYITMTFPYVLIFALGLKSDRISKKHFIRIGVVAFFVYLLFVLYFSSSTGAYQCTQICKYPPQLYYTSYAIVIVSLLWVSKNYISILFERLKLDGFLTFVGSHTLWVYYWHIIVLLIFEDKITSPFLLFSVVLLLAIVLDYIQVLIVKWLINKTMSDSAKTNMSILLLG